MLLCIAKVRYLQELNFIKWIVIIFVVNKNQWEGVKVKKVLITGASGFLGRYLACYLKQKEYEIIAYSRTEVNIEGVKWIKGDVLNLEELIRAMKDCEIVIHLAAITPYKKIKTFPFDAMKVYIKGTLNVLEALEKSSVKTLIFPSSGKVYGLKNSLPYNENEHIHPDILMGKMKAMAENEIKIYSEIKGNNYRFVIARIFNAYGWGQKSDFLIPKIIEHFDCGEITLGPMDVERDYIYISDVLSGINTLIDKAPYGYSIYNIGSGYPVSIDAITKKICKIARKEIAFVQDETEKRDNERKVEYADITKISLLGWKPQVSLDDGILYMLNQYRLGESDE